MAGANELSNREREVAALLLQGNGNKQIAAALGITVRTVEFHLSNVYRKLDVTSRTEAVLKLGKSRLWKSTDPRESTVGKGKTPVKNGDKPILRRNRMKNRLYIIGGSFLAVVIVAILVIFVKSSQASDFHSDEEIAREALQSAEKNFNSTEMTISTEDPVQIGTTVLNQFLRKFRQRETHYGIRLVSYEILELDFVEEDNGHLYYTAHIKVTPQDETRFLKIIDDVFPYEENDDGILFTFGFTVFQQGDMYKLIDVDSGEY